VQQKKALFTSVFFKQ